MAEESNGNQEKVKEVIAKVTGEEAKVIAVPTELIHFMGEMSSRGKTQKAVFLAQLIYWSDKGTRPDRFIYKTQKEWKKETGLSESQVASYTEEFKGLGLIETKNKKANGSPTIHYKLKMDIFLNSFKDYLQNGISSNSRNQSEETDDSITENTTQQNTSDSSLSNNYLQGEWEQENKEKIGNVKEASLSDNVDDSFNHNGSGSPAERILIPEDFTPTWEAKYRAIKTFPQKSPAYVTEKLIRKSREKGTRKTISEWHQEWWDWMNSERQSLGNVELENEHWEIRGKLLNDIYNASFRIPLHLFHYDELTFLLRNVYSEEAVLEGIEYLINKDVFALIGDNPYNYLTGYYIFNYREYKESEEYREKVNEGIHYYLGRGERKVILASETSPDINLKDIWYGSEDDD